MLELSPKGTYVMYTYPESLEDRVPSHDRYIQYLITYYEPTYVVPTYGDPRSLVHSLARGLEEHSTE